MQRKGGDDTAAALRLQFARARRREQRTKCGHKRELDHHCAQDPHRGEEAEGAHARRVERQQRQEAKRSGQTGGDHDGADLCDRADDRALAVSLSSEFFVVALEHLHGVARSDRENQNWRHDVVAIELRAEDAHEPKGPDRCKDASRDRDEHPLDASERTVEDGEQRKEGKCEVPADGARILLKVVPEDGQPCDVEVDIRGAIGPNDVGDHHESVLWVDVPPEVDEDHRRLRVLRDEEPVIGGVALVGRANRGHVGLALRRLRHEVFDREPFFRTRADVTGIWRCKAEHVRRADTLRAVELER